MASGKFLFEYRDETLQLDFECYLAAVGAEANPVMRKALRKFLQLSLGENDGIRREFEEIRAARLSQGTNVTVLPTKDKRGEEASSQGKKTPAKGG
jgi:hypothetical protein